MTLPDFKPALIAKLGSAPAVEDLLPDGTFQRGTVVDAGETIALVTGGKILPLTRRAIINDDLMSHDIDAHTRRNALLLGLVVFAIDFVCLATLFRSGRELGIVFGILATACVWTFGLAGLFGVSLSFLTC